MAEESVQAQVKEVRGNQSAANNPMPSVGDATITPPTLEQDGVLDLQQKSVRDASQAYEICKATEVSNVSRAARTSDIQAIFDGIPPRSSQDKLEKAQSWQHNFSTRWLAGIVKPVVMRFVNAVTSQIYLTRSALPPSYPNYKSKSDLFQSKATRLFRMWKGMTPFINRLAVENVLQGYTYAVFLDPYTWKPKAFKQDRAFVPEEAEQDAKELQFFVAKQDYLLADFISLFQDEKAAKDAGFDVENCNLAAANADIKDPREDAQTTTFRKFQEMLTDGALGLTYTMSAPRIVKTWLLWNKEYDNKVSFWIIGRDNGRLLRYNFKLNDEMSENVVVFTLDPGNGSIHSSLGLGRYLAAQAIVIERHRNRMLDNSMMAGLLVLKADPKDRNKQNTQVATPFVFLDKTIDIAEQQFEANSETYIAADNLITSWAEQIAGVYVQAQLQANGQSDKTATEASIDAARERELGDVVMRRWLDQFCDLIQVMQLRAFRDELLDEAERIWEKFQADPEEYDRRKAIKASSDPEAIEVILELYGEQVTKEEIQIMRSNPASGFSHVDVAVIAQGMQAASVKYKGDTRVDQNKLLRYDLESMVGPDVTRDLVVEQADQTVMAVAQREQIEEIAAMTQVFQPVPVVPSDNHKGHIVAILPFLTMLKQKMELTGGADAQLMKESELILNHLGEHLQAMLVAGMKQDPIYRAGQQFYEGFKKDLLQIAEVQAHAAAAAAAVTAKLRAEGATLPPPAAGGAAPGPGNVTPITAGAPPTTAAPISTPPLPPPVSAAAPPAAALAA